MSRIFHVWFSTKYRQPVLEGAVAADVRQLLLQIAAQIGVEMVETAAAGDHVHLLVTSTGGLTLPQAMHRLKGASSRYIRLKHSDLEGKLESVAFWQKGYGWREVMAHEIATVRRYIRAHEAKSEHPVARRED